jgi:hypothetical protein
VREVLESIVDAALTVTHRARICAAQKGGTGELEIELRAIRVMPLARPTSGCLRA